MPADAAPALPLLDTGTLPQRPPARGPRRVLGVLLFCGLLAGLSLLRPGRAAPDAPLPPTGAEVVALGRLQPAGDPVTLAPPFGAADARIARLYFAEGDTVPAGAVVADLDSLTVLGERVIAAQAAIATREAALMQARSQVAAALAEADAERAVARASEDLALRQRERQQALLDRGLVPRSTLDVTVADAVRATRERERAEIRRRRLQGGDAQSEVALAAQQLAQARAELAVVEAERDRARVRTDTGGTLLAVHVRVGEKPGAAGIATLADVSQMEAELEVYQSDRGRLALDQSVQLTSPALDQPLQGTVSRLGLRVERQSVLAADPAANTDARVVRVRIALDADSRRRAAAWTGLEVTGRIAVTP
jgi:HlyD family secretion protein